MYYNDIVSKSHSEYRATEAWHKDPASMYYHAKSKGWSYHNALASQ